MKQKHAKRSQTKIDRRKWGFGFLFFAVAVLAVSQAVFNAYIYRRINRPADQNVVTNLIISAVENLHKPAPIDAATGKVYFPDVKLVLPAPDNPRTQVVYSNANDSSAPQLQVSDSNILHRAEAKLWAAQANKSGWRQEPSDVFEQLPKLQACSRGVQIFFSPASEDYGPDFHLRETKKLANGQTIYFYTEPPCQADLEPLLDYLKQAQSY